MTLHLLPYTIARHLAIGLQLGSAALVAWSVVQLGVVAGTSWGYHTFGLIGWQELDGIVFLSALVVAVTMGSLILQGSLVGRSLRWRLGLGTLAAAIAVPGFVLTHVLFSVLLQAGAPHPRLDDPSLVSLRFHLFGWLAAGGWAGLGTLAARSAASSGARRFTWARDGAPAPARRPWSERATSIFVHLGGGLAAGGLAGAVWHTLGHYPALGGELYVASAAGAATFGAVSGGLFWGVPHHRYQGWIRVLSPTRFGWRIPVSVDGAAAERFVGHYPRGLDLYLPEVDGLAELHCSIVVDDNGQYAVRGLSTAATLVRRSLEAVDLRYDPSRPAPLETPLRNGDRIVLGEGDAETVLEFVLLPRGTDS